MDVDLSRLSFLLLPTSVTKLTTLSFSQAQSSSPRFRGASAHQRAFVDHPSTSPSLLPPISIQSRSRPSTSSSPSPPETSIKRAEESATERGKRDNPLEKRVLEWTTGRYNITGDRPFDRCRRRLVLFDRGKPRFCASTAATSAKSKTPTDVEFDPPRE